MAHRIQQLLIASLTTLASQLVSADVTLQSSDGKWAATIKDSGGGAGECLGLSDLDELPVYQNNVTQTRHYVRLAGNFSFASALTVRMEDTFSLVSFSHTSSEFNAVVKSDLSSGVIAMIHGEMISGNTGGLRVSMSFADTTPSNQPFLSTIVKPFVYVNMNVDGQMTSNTGSWSVDHYHQTATNVLTGNTRWFVGRAPTAHSSNHDSLMQDTLDNGVIELNNTSWTGPGDINTAISFAQGALSAGSVHTVAYAVGNEGMSIPATFGLPPSAGTVGISSLDGRWGATIRTGNVARSSGNAGAIDAMFDFDQPLSTSQFLNDSSYYAAVTDGDPIASATLSDSFSRLGFFLQSGSSDAFSAILNSKELPGLLAIIDGRLVSGTTGGLVTSIRYADVSGATRSVTPLVYADLNVDNTVSNVGAFVSNHFQQSVSGQPFTNSRWFRSNVFGSYASDVAWSLSAALNSGIVALSNVQALGPADISTAFAYAPHVVGPNQQYVIAFAIGNAGIAIPASIVVPTQPSICPADVSGDGFVDAADLATLLGAWGPVMPGTLADLTGDNEVDAADLAVLLGAWGMCDWPE